MDKCLHPESQIVGSNPTWGPIYLLAGGAVIENPHRKNMQRSHRKNSAATVPKPRGKVDNAPASRAGERRFKSHRGYVCMVYTKFPFLIAENGLFEWRRCI